MYFCPYNKQCPLELNSPPQDQSLFQYPDSNKYRIKSGDTFYRISKFYNVSPDDLLDLNPEVDPDKLQIGQVIYIPVTPPVSACSPGSNSYIVQKGDTFYKIAKKFNLPISALIKANPRVNPDALLTGLSICIPKLFNKYSNSEYGVNLMYPLRWIKTNNERYEGIDGFFKISALFSADDIEEICRQEARHRLKPYGAKPTITKAIVNGQLACYVFPSSDQPMEMHEQAALVVEYPKQVEIAGQECNYFILWADKSHIRSLASSLDFME